MLQYFFFIHSTSVHGRISKKYSIFCLIISALLRSQRSCHWKNPSYGHLCSSFVTLWMFLFLKLIIAGAFYPNYFLSGEIDEKESIKMMSGHNPFTTVMVRSCVGKWLKSIYCFFLSFWWKLLSSLDSEFE